MLINLCEEQRYLSEEKIKRIAAKKARGKLGFGGPQVEVEHVRTRYKQIHFVKLLALAARTPMPPKKIGYVLYFDTVLGKGGLTPGVPRFAEQEVAEEDVLESRYTVEDLEKQRSDLIERHIFKQYLLKRPDIKHQGIESVYLTYRECVCKVDGKRKTVLINAATGKADM